MASAAIYSSPEAVCNAVLARLGAKRRIGSLYEGSEPAMKFLDIYSQARDAKLRSFAWGFAGRNQALQLLKAAPVGGYNPVRPWNPVTDPLMGWIFEYAYPADMLKLRSLRSPSDPVPNFDPRPKLWQIANDTIAGIQQKVILCNKATAVAVYTGQVTDPTLWEAGFTDALIAELARLVAPAIAGWDAEKIETQEDIAVTTGAEGTLG